MSKRTSFIGHQLSHYVPVSTYKPGRVRTGFEKVISHRVSPPFAFPAKQDGKILDIDEKLSLIKVKYKDGTIETIPYHQSYTKSGGHYITQNVKPNVKKGETVKQNDVLAYNSDFFSADPMSKQVDWNIGIPATVALIDSDDSIEDSNAISSNFSKKLSFTPVNTRDVIVATNTYVHKAINIGMEVEPDTPLMVFEDGDVGDLTQGENQDDLIARVSRSIPKAKHHGKIVRVEVLYTCKLTEMHDTLSKAVKAYTKDQQAQAKYAEGSINANTFPDAKPLKATDKIGPLMLDNKIVIFRYYIQEEIPGDHGSKIVLGSSLKSVTSKVYDTPIYTEDGEEIDVVFSTLSISNRITNSPFIQGIISRVMHKLEDEVVADYFK
jgi:hypothetical protein